MWYYCTNTHVEYVNGTKCVQIHFCLVFTLQENIFSRKIYLRKCHIISGPLLWFQKGLHCGKVFAGNCSKNKKKKTLDQIVKKKLVALLTDQHKVFECLLHQLLSAKTNVHLPCLTNFNLGSLLFGIFLCDLFLFLTNIHVENYHRNLQKLVAKISKVKYSTSAETMSDIFQIADNPYNFQHKLLVKNDSLIFKLW